MSNNDTVTREEAQELIKVLHPCDDPECQKCREYRFQLRFARSLIAALDRAEKAETEVERRGKDIEMLMEDKRAAEARLAKAREFFADYACEPCEYGDGCPTFRTRHGKCLPCRCREALAATDPAKEERT